ncbi:unnamed protein product [Vicia faba]|uniref:Uncharacterized protein n=1 Tax=Vicia faba TaxID=3906 RepID=A0AAV0YH67_VICFA|nr:unnamed protein product [Vicia faba]
MGKGLGIAIVCPSSSMKAPLPHGERRILLFLAQQSIVSSPPPTDSMSHSFIWPSYTVDSHRKRLPYLFAAPSSFPPISATVQNHSTVASYFFLISFFKSAPHANHLLKTASDVATSSVSSVHHLPEDKSGVSLTLRLSMSDEDVKQFAETPREDEGKFRDWRGCLLWIVQAVLEPFLDCRFGIRWCEDKKPSLIELRYGEKGNNY